MELAIDIETYSETDIKLGVHKYIEDPNFEILMIAYSINGGEVKLIDLCLKDEIPYEFAEALCDPNILKTAYNASFEITCLNKEFNFYLDPNQWSCTMALAAQAGLPFGLDSVAKALKTISQKDSKGKDLVKYFTMPCKPTKSNGLRSRNLFHHDFDKWLDFRSYCMQDVYTEQDVRRQLKWFEISSFEKPMWTLDQKINNAGVRIDLDLVRNAIKIEDVVTKKLTKEMTELTNIANPKSNTQIKKFIEKKSGIIINSLSKTAMPDVVQRVGNIDIISKVLKIRDQLSKTSIKKFTAMINSVCGDGKIRGLFQYYGANRTGRWAGRNVQLQNLKRNKLKDLDFARKLVKENNLDALELSYDSIADVLSNLIRTSFIPDEGNNLIVSDFSSIEARIVAWFAGETWRLDVFKTHGKIYEASASMMFKIPIDQIDEDLRMKGKIAELALGYQGSVGALERMGGSSMGLSQSEMLSIVRKWRKASPKIVKLWYTVQDCFIEAVTNGYAITKYLKFKKKNNNIIIELPSGRELVYIDAKFDGTTITYMGMDQETKQWCIQETYGGKLVENIVQATARDVLANALLNVDKAGYNIIMHVHDEIVIDSRTDFSEQITKILSTPISWAPGLILEAKTFITKYYQK